MATLGLLYRYVISMAKTFMGRFERDFELCNAKLCLEGVENSELVTAEMCAALASRDLTPIHNMLSEKMAGHNTLWGKILCTYSYKSTGPYTYYISEHNPSFPPAFAEQTTQINTLVPLEKTVILAERGNNQEDVTEQVMPFLGPDGTFHGMVNFETDDWSGFDIKAIFPDLLQDEQVELTFADGHTISLQPTDPPLINQEEEEEI